MRFAQVPMGARFEYEGEPCVRTGPLVATHETSGKPRMLGRYVEVRVHGEAATVSASAAATAGQERATVLQRFRQRSLELLEQDGTLDAAGRERLRTVIELVYRELSGQA
jgi:hypothetical protein